MRRMWCTLFGCLFDRNIQACHRCGEFLYEGFIETGRLSPLIRGVRKQWHRFWSRIVGSKCCHCGRRFWGQGYIDCCVCSKECEQKFVPF